MPFEGSTLWRLRQKVGSDPVLHPGAITFLVDDEGAVLFTRRVDNGRWCLPAGGAEEGSSFADTAVTELREETGVEVDSADLIAFACLSEADLHTITYPGGDVTHCFAMVFLARRWTGEPRPDGVETTEMLWAAPAAPPSPLERPAELALDLFRAYGRTGEFQVS
ncbi:MAG: NUDIX domain-containing protein [Actinobacteria bacterium]|nr:NUDIX domain-containing protein [Actinomycetota bacterium]OJU83673.1 MAG: NUDIX hydrolase [Solirubrobacterales bacterium 70-9]